MLFKIIVVSDEEDARLRQQAERRRIERIIAHVLQQVFGPPRRAKPRRYNGPKRKRRS